MSHLRGLNGGLVLDDLQRALDPGVPVRVAPGWTVEVKDHQFVCLCCQLEEGLQAADRLVPHPLSVGRSQGAGRAERIVLEGTGIDSTSLIL